MAKILSMPAAAAPLLHDYIYKEGTEYITLSESGYSYTGYTNDAPIKGASAITLASPLAAGHMSMIGTVNKVDVTSYSSISFVTDQGTFTYDITSVTGECYIVFGMFASTTRFYCYGTTAKANISGNKIFQGDSSPVTAVSTISEVYFD